MKDKHLKGCPFCGGIDLKKLADEDFVYCEECGAKGPNGDDEAEAIELWNKRICDPEEDESEDNEF